MQSNEKSLAFPTKDSVVGGLHYMIELELPVWIKAEPRQDQGVVRRRIRNILPLEIFC
jgi:hypothetical protein